MNYKEFAARQKHVELNGIAHHPVSIAYTDIGEGDSVILMHGIPTWSFLYHEVIDQLAEHHRVIAPDFIGHGMSDQRDTFDRSLLAQRQMILALMDRLGIKRATNTRPTPVFEACVSHKPCQLSSTSDSYG